MEFIQTELTERQKLHVLATRFYNQIENQWQPKKGDYYTTPRADLELYYIIDETEDSFLTVYCNTSRYANGIVIPSEWPKTKFLQGFGINRIHVMPQIFNI